MQQPVPAGKWRRFFNFVIDYVGLVFVASTLAYLVWQEAALTFLNQTSDLLIGLLAALVYYIGMEGLLGRTLGKLATGTRVVNGRGEKASFGQIVGRTFARFIPFEAFSFLGATGRGWHDSLANTYVIMSRDD